MKSIIGMFVAIFYATIFLTGCGGGESESSNTDSGTVQISGAGIKGPLAFADAKIFAFDPSFPDYYDNTSPISIAITNQYAEIQELSVPRNIKPPYILIIDGGNAIDLNTSVAPIINTLITVVTDDMLANNSPIFSTPLTTLVFHMARLNTETISYKGNRAKSKAFSKNISSAASIVSSTFAVVQDTNIDLFRAPLVINDYTTDLADQELAVYHRAAVEAFAAKVYSLAILGDISSDTIIEYLALDLHNDSVIDNSDNGAFIGNIDPVVMSQDSMKLLIPNTLYRIEEIMLLMEEERILLGTNMGPAFLIDEIVFPETTTTTDTATTPSDTTSTESPGTGTTVASEPVVTFSVDSIDFGSLGVNETSNPIEIVLTNSGTAPLNISGISISSGFTEANNCNNEVPASGSCVFDIQFIPTSLGNTSGVLTISSNDSVGTHSISLTGSANNPAPADTLINSGPIVIDGQQNVVISGLHITNPNGHCIKVIGGSSNITIENSEIGPCGRQGIGIAGSSDVLVQNNWIHDIWNEAVYSYDSNDITVNSNRIEDVKSGYEMWNTTIGNLSFTNNWVKNVNRRAGMPNGGNIAMAAYVEGGSIRINNNVGINILGESNPEDLVNIYKSSGTPDDPIQIKNNKFYGGGPSQSGGGILLGDKGGSYQIAENNILVSPGGYGIAIAGGHHHTLRNNKVYTPVEVERTWNNVGLYVWNQSGLNCSSHTVGSNEITFWQSANYRNAGGDAFLNPAWNSGNCGPVAEWDSNKFDSAGSHPANLDESIWDSAWNTP